MSTRSVVAKRTPKGWKGVYVHWDGYPSGVGLSVFQSLKASTPEERRKVMQAVVSTRQGFSIMAGKDLRTLLREQPMTKPGALPSGGYSAARNHFEAEQAAEGPIAYDASQGGGTAFSHRTPVGSCGVEYLYVVDDDGMSIYTAWYVSSEFKGQRMIGMFGMGAPQIGKGKDVIWRQIGRVKWDEEWPKALSD